MNERTFFQKTSVLYFFYLLLIFLVVVLTHNGGLVFCAIVVISIFNLIEKKNIESLTPFFLTLMINNSLIELPISFFGGITPTAFICLYFIIIIILANFKYREKFIHIGKVLFPIWCCYLLFNTIWTNTSNIGNTIFTLCSPMVISIYLQWYASRNNGKYRITLLSSILTGVVFMCFCGYIELFIGKTFFYSDWTGAERYRYGIIRVGSTVADSNFFSLTELVAIPIINIPIVKKLIGNRGQVLFQIFLSLSIILTFSRTGLITLIFIYAAMFSKKHSKLVVAFFPGCSMLILGFLSRIIGTINTLDANSYLSRRRIIEGAFAMWRKKPIFGWGNNAFFNNSISIVGLQRSTMNEYMDQLVSFGIVGLFFYGLFLISIVYQGTNHFSDFKNGNSLYYLIICIIWVMMSISLNTYSKIFIWLVPSIIIAINRIESRE